VCAEPRPVRARCGLVALEPSSYTPEGLALSQLRRAMGMCSAAFMIDRITRSRRAMSQRDCLSMPFTTGGGPFNQP
jgi:hypothetical protein